jgi:hypothetical protein
MKRLAAFMTVMLLALSVAGTAWAANSSDCQAYNTCSTTTAVTTTPSPSVGATTTTAAATTLPFTGMDVGLLLLGGVGLLGAGFAVRRFARRLN